MFDFKPGIDAGAEVLSRRGEDHRFTDQRPAARRRRAIDEAMPERSEEETRADVARRIDQARLIDDKIVKASRPQTGPMAYEIGSADDPDRRDEDIDK